MKLFLILILCTLITIISIRVNLNQTEIPNTSASSSANSLSLGNYHTETSLNVKATATHGNKADATSAAGAKTNNLDNQITAQAQADATDNKLVENEIYKEKISTYDKNSKSEIGLLSESYNTKQFEANSKRTVTLQDEENKQNKFSSQVDNLNNYENESQGIKDETYDLSTIENNTKSDNSSNYFTQTQKREIVITIDAGSEKLIIERIIGNDNRVLIVSAAKYLKKSLPKEVKDYFQELYDQKCNCKLIREYAMDLLAEGE
jgi:hypothetical protein